jgi:hypothetical protein
MLFAEPATVAVLIVLNGRLAMAELEEARP